MPQTPLFITFATGKDLQSEFHKVQQTAALGNIYTQLQMSAEYDITNLEITVIHLNVLFILSTIKATKTTQ